MGPPGANRSWLMQLEATDSAVAQVAAAGVKPAGTKPKSAADVKSAGQGLQVQPGAQDKERKESAGASRLGRGDDVGKDAGGGSGEKGKEQQLGHSGVASKAPKLSDSVAACGNIGGNDGNTHQARQLESPILHDRTLL
jgi:hypothetical protein